MLSCTCAIGFSIAHALAHVIFTNGCTTFLGSSAWFSSQCASLAVRTQRAKGRASLAHRGHAGTGAHVRDGRQKQSYSGGYGGDAQKEEGKLQGWSPLHSLSPLLKLYYFVGFARFSGPVLRGVRRTEDGAGFP